MDQNKDPKPPPLTAMNPVTNITDFYKGMAADPVTTIRQVFRGAVEGTMSENVHPLAKIISPIEVVVGISSILHGLSILNPIEIGLGVVELGDGLGRYMQIGRELEKGPPPAPVV